MTTITETKVSRSAFLSLRARSDQDEEQQEIEEEEVKLEESVEEEQPPEEDQESIGLERREPVVIVTPPKRTRSAPHENAQVADDQATTAAFPPSPHLHARDMIRVPATVREEDEKVQQVKQRIQRSTLHRFSLTTRLLLGGTTITLLSGSVLYYFFAWRHK